MGLLKFLSRRKVVNSLENEYYGIIDCWLYLKYCVNKGLVAKNDAIDILKTTCNNARKNLEQVKYLDAEIYDKYLQIFNRCFDEIQEYIDTSLSGLKV